MYEQILSEERMAVKYTRTSLLSGSEKRKPSLWYKSISRQTVRARLAPQFRILVLILPVLLFVFLFFPTRKYAPLICEATVTGKERLEIVQHEFEHIIYLRVMFDNQQYDTGATVETEVWDALETGDLVWVECVRLPDKGLRVITVRHQ